MSRELSRDTMGGLFMNLMQHLKCIEVRLDYARAASSQKQKYAINNALNKARGAINAICDLLGDGAQVQMVKKELDKVDLVYIMLLTEQLFELKEEDMQEITELIDNYLKQKYGESVQSEQV